MSLFWIIHSDDCVSYASHNQLLRGSHCEFEVLVLCVRFFPLVCRRIVFALRFESTERIFFGAVAAQETVIKIELIERRYNNELVRFIILFLCYSPNSGLMDSSAKRVHINLCIIIFRWVLGKRCANHHWNEFDRRKKDLFWKWKKRSHSILLVTNACILKRFNYNIKSIVLCVVRSIGVTAAAAEET